MISDNELNRPQRKIGQKYALLANTVTPIGTYVITGALMIIYAGDVLHLSTSKISGIMSIIPLVGLLRFFLLKVLSSIGKVRLIQSSAIFKAIIVIGMILIPPKDLSYTLYLSLLISFSLLNQLGLGTAWQPLLRDITTNQDRGRFFSRMRLVFTLISLVVTGIIPLIIGESISSVEYKIFLFFPLLAQINMVIMVHKVPEIPYVKNSKKKLSLTEIVKELKTLTRPLFMIILVQCTFFPLFVLYLKQGLNLPSNIVTTAVFVGTLGNAVSLLFWGNISDTLGFKNTLTGVHILGLLQIPFLFLIQPDKIYGLMIYSFIDGMVLAGSGIAMTSIQHYYTTKERSIFIFSVYGAITLIINAIWIFINGQVISGFSNPLVILDGVKVFMIIVAVVSRIILFVSVQKIPNIRPWFGLGDFFTSLNPTSFRTMIQVGRLHKLDDNRREQMSYSLGRRGNPFSINSLISLLKDPSYDVKVSAIRELGRSGSELAGKRLFTMLQNPYMSIYHEHIVWALGQLQWEEATEIIISFLQSDRSEKLKAVSARSLGRIGATIAVPILKELVKTMTPTFHLSSSACGALIKLDMKSNAALVFNSLQLYKDNNIRYEIMDLICPHLNINNEWILKHGQDQGGYLALMQFSEERPSKWRQENRIIIEALQLRDYEKIKDQYNIKFSKDNNSIYTTLNDILDKQTEWVPLCLLASAQLLLI
ncbi:MAG: MFS transporter [Spirochaetaceae bacterium]